MARHSGFTLIELSIVLVVIGLIVGGVLVGQDLVNAARIRAQVSQIESYSAAAQTFKTKYACIPGDCQTRQAASIGLYARAGGPGDGDGNGLVNVLGIGVSDVYDRRLGGENVFFWTDLTFGNLIDGRFATSADAIVTSATTQAQFAALLPAARIGGQNYITVGASAYDDPRSNIRVNYFQTVRVFAVNGSGLFHNSGITPLEAQSMDTKVDDGMPRTGAVMAMGSKAGGGPWYASITLANAIDGGMTSPDIDCVQVGAQTLYNTANANRASTMQCSLMFKASF